MSHLYFLRRNLFIRGVVRLVKRYFIRKSQFGSFGKDARITPPCSISGFKNVYFGEGCVIGADAILYATNAKIIFKNYVISANGLKIVTGAHERRIGRYCATISEKEKDSSKELDSDVVIEEDVWFGLNVQVMPGVIVGRGATIGAGSVITKSIPPYCIAVGIPAKPVKFYWTIEQILEHESKLYPVEKRYTKKQLEEHRKIIE